MSIGPAFAIVIFPPACEMTLLVSELAYATRAMREPLNRAAPFRFAFLSAFSVPRSRHPRPSDARSPSQNPRCASQEVRTPPPRQAVVPFRRFYPVAEGVGLYLCAELVDDLLEVLDRGQLLLHGRRKLSGHVIRRDADRLIDGLQSELHDGTAPALA
jgi:hypothetical protein